MKRLHRELMLTFSVTFLLSAFFVETRAQSYPTNPVGVGTRTPHSSAALHLSSSNKGILMPKVALTGATDQTTVHAPKKGLMVYNTAKAGQVPDDVEANNVYVWVGTRWEKFSSLPEIRKLKKPIHFVLSSKEEQKLNSNLSLFNNSGGSPVQITWKTADILVPNVADVELQENSVKIKTASFYEITGSVNFKSDSDGPTSVAVILQKSNNNGSSWANIASSVLTYEEGAYNKSQTIVFPAVTHRCEANTLLRFVLKKAGGANQKATAGIAYDPPKEGDITKTFRLSRLREETE